MYPSLVEHLTHRLIKVTSADDDVVGQWGSRLRGLNQVESRARPDSKNEEADRCERVRLEPREKTTSGRIKSTRSTDKSTRSTSPSRSS